MKSERKLNDWRRKEVVIIRFVVVVQFRGDKLACERIYWDQAAVLRQVGLFAG